MLGKLKISVLGENQMYLAGKRVEIPKLSPNKCKKILGSVDKLPGLFVQILLSSRNDFFSTLFIALELAMDEICEVVAVLTDIDVELIKNDSDLNEIVEFLTKVYERNDFKNLARNFQILMPVSSAT